MPLEEDIETELSPGERARRQFRIFLANLAIALGWALKHSCKGCAHRLFTTARWLVPEAQRFLVCGSGLDNRHRRMRTRLSLGQSHRIAAGFLIVLVLLGSLHLATRATAISTQPLLGTFVSQHQSLPETSGRMQKLNSQAAPVLERQKVRGSLPARKPQSIYKIPNEKRVKAATHKRMAQKKPRGNMR